jgi:protein-S-isoprenylcysteine O-methyltransferase Ste14
MIWFVVFSAIICASIICTCQLVPLRSLQNYSRYREDRWAAGLFNAIWTVAALQYFLAAPTAPTVVVLHISGAGIMIGGFALVIWARRHNPFFVPAVVVPDYIVASGPYSRIDHPGYLGMGLTACGAFLLLGQPWAVFPTVGYLYLLIRRIHAENRMLSVYFQNYQ